MTERQLATVLAAVKMWQDFERRENPLNNAEDYWEISTGRGNFEGLDDAEIEELLLALNGGEVEIGCEVFLTAFAVDRHYKAGGYASVDEYDKRLLDNLNYAITAYNKGMR